MNRSSQSTRVILSIAFVILFGVLCSHRQCSFAVEGVRSEQNPLDIAALIDDRLHIHDREAPIAYADDATFLRRVTLDLVGRIPTISEVHEFLGDTSQAKRLQAIERLVSSGAHYQNMATFWRRAWVPQADTGEFASVADGFETWLAQELRRGTPYDQLVRAIVTWNDDSATTDAIDPSGFYVANEAMPANLAASATRAFLGINLDCAQCHDHPFASWSREQFWQTAAFFAEPKRSAEGITALPVLKVSDSELEYSPKLLSKADVTWPDELDNVALKSVFAEWMLAEDQDYLARNAVNRLWSHFFGEALIEPIDDLSSDTAQTGPRAELLHELAEVFIDSGYNTELLTRAIVQSDAYRLVPSPIDIVTDPNSVAKTAARVRGLSGEQLYNSLLTAAGLPLENTFNRKGQRRGRRQSFVMAFHVERPHEAERSISQALTLMNGSFANELSTKADNKMLAAVLASPFMSFGEQIDTVFVAVLGRHASEAERLAVLRHAEYRDEDSRQRCLGSLFWALINGPEFSSNH